MTGRPKPDPLAFEEPVMVLKKHKKDNSPVQVPDTPPAEYTFIPESPSTPLVCPKAPSKTPLRSPNGNNNNNNNGVHFLTQRKRTKSSSTHFIYLQKLGEGCFGEVWKAKHVLDDHLYAVKKSKKPIWETHERSHQLQEIEKGMKLGYHPNIATVMAAWEEGGHLYIQMELCERGNLKDALNAQEGGIEEAMLWQHITDISLGLEHVHANGIIHLDIKPENLLFGNDSTLKICDFGVSVTNGDTEGDQVYMAPELLDENYTQAADIFSFGITIYECVTNYVMPAQGQWWRNLRSGNIPFPEDIHISNELKQLITAMMNPDPTQRIDIKGILEIERVKEIVALKKVYINIHILTFFEE
eukprot:gene13852-16336_t